jgi:hypothetical protein
VKPSPAFTLGVRHAREGVSRPPAHLTPEQRREWRAGFYGFTPGPSEPIKGMRWSPSPIKSAESSAKSARRA